MGSTKVARRARESKAAGPRGSQRTLTSCARVPIMVEMGGFVFCSDGNTAAYGLVTGRKAGR